MLFAAPTFCLQEEYCNFKIGIIESFPNWENENIYKIEIDSMEN